MDEVNIQIPTQEQKKNRIEKKKYFLYIGGLLLFLGGVIVGRMLTLSTQRERVVVQPSPINTKPSGSISPQVTIDGSSSKVTWVQYKSTFSNIAFMYPDNWQVKAHEQTTAPFPMAWYQIISPQKLVIIMHLGVTGVGGGCQPDALSAIQYEPVIFMGKTYDLRFVSQQDQLKKQATTNNSLIDYAVVLNEPQGCINVAWLTIPNLGVDFGEKEKHEGVTSVTISYVKNTTFSDVTILDSNSNPKILSDFKSSDYEIAKKILSSATYATP